MRHVPSVTMTTNLPVARKQCLWRTHLSWIPGAVWLYLSLNYCDQQTWRQITALLDISDFVSEQQLKNCNALFFFFFFKFPEVLKKGSIVCLEFGLQSAICLFGPDCSVASDPKNSGWQMRTRRKLHNAGCLNGTINKYVYILPKNCVSHDLSLDLSFSESAACWHSTVDVW